MAPCWFEAGCRTREAACRSGCRKDSTSSRAIRSASRPPALEGNAHHRYVIPAAERLARHRMRRHGKALSLFATASETIAYDLRRQIQAAH